MVQGGGSNEQVEVTNEDACGSETATFSAKGFRDVRVKTKHGDTPKKVVEILLIPFRIA